MPHRKKAAAGWIALAALAAPACTKEQGGERGGEQSAPKRATLPTLHFEPRELHHPDVAVGETLVERVALVADAPIDWTPITVATTCECLAAEFVGTPTPTRAEVEVRIFGLKSEELDGGILAEGTNHTLLADLTARLSIGRRPFLQPREVFVEKGIEGHFEIVVGQAFPTDAELPPSVLEDLGAYDEAKIALLEMPDESERTEQDVILRTVLKFVVVDDARPTPFETTVPISLGVPPVNRSVKVHWPGR